MKARKTQEKLDDKFRKVVDYFLKTPKPKADSESSPRGSNVEKSAKRKPARKRQDDG